MIARPCMRVSLITLLCVVAQAPLVAQIVKVPPTSRTVFKCTVNGQVQYSDAPCLGAQVLDIQPTRGLNKSSGKEMTGRDVMIEKNHEAFTQAVQPATGMDQKQFDVAKRRVYMSGPQKAECVKLDGDIAASEAQERAAAKNGLAAVQGRLLTMRTRYRGLGC